MASILDLHSKEVLVNFRMECGISVDVEVHPLVEGEVVEYSAIVISSYLLMVVGLRFPLLALFYYLLEILHNPLEIC